MTRMRHYLIAAMAFFAWMAGAVATASAQCPSQWLPGDGFDLRGCAPSDVIHTLIHLPNGDLVAGGQFTVAGGIAVSNIARWDGSIWSPLGSGIQGGAVRALAVLPNGDLVAGGEFSTAGGIAVNKIARWDGSAWSSLGSGIGGGASPSVLALTVANGDLVVGGEFTAAGGIAVSNIARWNGTWTAIGVGQPQVVSALTTLPHGTLVAGTTSPNVWPYANATVSVWNGTGWSTVGNPHTLGTFRPMVLQMQCTAMGELLIAGGFFDVGYTGASGVALWNGSNWTSLGTGVRSPEPVRALTILANGDVVIGGHFSSAGGVVCSNLARWDGTQWSPLGRPSGDVHALTTGQNGTMTVSGMFEPYYGGVNNDMGHRIARWGCGTGIAASTRSGCGCYWRATSFYEHFWEARSFDLGSSTLQLTLTAAGYDVVHVPGTPSFLVPSSSSAIWLGDDDLYPISLPFSIPYPGGTTNQIVVGSNGYVFLQFSQDYFAYYGSSSGFLMDAPRHAAMFKDLDPSFPGTGAGTIHLEVVGQTVYVSWMGVQEYGAPGVLCTFQIALSANGAVEYRYLACDHFNPAMTGWSSGYTAQDPTSRDLTGFGPFSTTSASFQLPLQLAAVTRPMLGTSVVMQTSNVPASSPLGATAIGFLQYDPGLDLTNLGMPGCFQYASADSVSMFLPTAGGGSRSFQLPLWPVLIGAHLYSQAVAFVPGANALGAVSSNGVDLILGN